MPDLAGWPLDIFEVGVSAVRESVRMLVSECIWSAPMIPAL